MPLFRRRKKPPPTPLAEDRDFRREFRTWLLAAGTPRAPDQPHWSAMLRMIEERHGRGGQPAGEPGPDVWDVAVANEVDRLAGELGWSADDQASFAAALHGVIEQLLRLDIYGADERTAYDELERVARELRLDRAPPGAAGEG